MNFDKFFALAASKGISESQIKVSKSSSMAIKLFRHEIENFSVSDSQNVIAAGIVNGKFGSSLTEKLDKDTFEFLVDRILRSASLNEKQEEADIFKGSEKYHKRNVYNPALEDAPAEEKLAIIKAVEDKAYAADSRVAEVEVSYSEHSSESCFYNSFGLKLKQKSNYFYVALSVVLRDGDQTKTNWAIFLDQDLGKLDQDALVKEAVEGAAKKFGADSIASKKYPTVINREVMANLIDYFLSSAVADEVQRHSSMLEGKLGQKIASSKLTIEEKPLTKNVFFSYFDGEGVATQNKVVVKNGVLKTYFYNRETAKKDGVESTGNGTWGGGRVGTGFGNIFVKPGKQSFDELISGIKDGVYITDVAGLGTGMNAVSGDFSCQAEGFHIVDGKLAEPLTLITLSGNLLKMLKDLKGFANDVKMTLDSISIASAYIKSMNIGGK
ncbi:MAG: TldD/PmbA family protein [Bacilli bacterium]|nr:TldD/PmbA family protein [Bacilli bacterium]